MDDHGTWSTGHWSSEWMRSIVRRGRSSAVPRCEVAISTSFPGSDFSAPPLGGVSLVSPLSVVGSISLPDPRAVHGWLSLGVLSLILSWEPDPVGHPASPLHPVLTPARVNQARPPCLRPFEDPRLGVTGIGVAEATHLRSVAARRSHFSTALQRRFAVRWYLSGSMHDPHTYGLGESGLPGRPIRFLRFPGSFGYVSPRPHIDADRRSRHRGIEAVPTRSPQPCQASARRWFTFGVTRTPDQP